MTPEEEEADALREINRETGVLGYGHTRKQRRSIRQFLKESAFRIIRRKPKEDK